MSWVDYDEQVVSSWWPFRPTLDLSGRLYLQEQEEEEESSILGAWIGSLMIVVILSAPEAASPTSPRALLLQHSTLLAAFSSPLSSSNYNFMTLRSAYHSSEVHL